MKNPFKFTNILNSSQINIDDYQNFRMNFSK